MANNHIGDPLDILKEYVTIKQYRSIKTMTQDEARLIIEFAIDNGDWHGPAVNHIVITSFAGNFVEGNISFGKGDTYYFTIRYDGTVSIHKMEFDEKKMEFKHTKNTLPIYRFSDIIFFMMKRGFDLIDHLK